MNQTRGQLKTLDGVVVSDKMDKTIVVSVARKYKHPKYGKFITTHKKYYAHDEKQEANLGDEVTISYSRPLSKTKRWNLVKITRKVVQL
ncbi:MAG: 30S ribosomal protein S17 [bacterium]